MPRPKTPRMFWTSSFLPLFSTSLYSSIVYPLYLISTVSSFSYPLFLVFVRYAPCVEVSATATQPHIPFLPRVTSSFLTCSSILSSFTFYELGIVLEEDL
jgi:uncharacterized membrane protein